MVSREDFRNHVRDALAHFHDPVRLQANPLTALSGLASGVEEPSAVALREALRQAIERLRPSAEVPVIRPEWMGYRLLLLRYVRSQSVQTVCEEMGLSTASFYRYHHDALEAVSSVLWEKYHWASQPIYVVSSDRPAAPVLAQTDGQATQEVVRLARQAQYQKVDLSTVLDASIEFVGRLAAQSKVSLAVDCEPALPVIYGDPAMLRQILLNVLTEGIRLTADGVLHLAVRHEGNETVWRVSYLDPSRAAAASLDAIGGFEVGRALLNVYGGRLWSESEPPGQVLLFTLPVDRVLSVLIIDDDADTIRLYQRYLQAHRFHVMAARSAGQAHSLLADELPDLILLDVLMPGEDGWDILNRLKSEPLTAHIPVVICSVLKQPDLALSLGAVEVLNKPIQEETLIGAVHRLLVQLAR